MNKTTSIIIIVVLLFISICVGVSSATIEMSNIEQGDFIWGTINVDTPGLVSVNAWTNGSGSGDLIGLYLYNQTGNMVDSKSNWHQTSIDYIAPNDGTYTVKAYLDQGGTRTISVSGNHPLSLMPKYNRIAFDIAQGNAIWYDLSVKKGGQAFVNAWINGSNHDLIGLYLYNQTGNMVASKSNWRQTSIDYIAPNDGTYTVKAYLDEAWEGGTRTILVSTNYPFESSPTSAPKAQTSTTSTPTTTEIPTPTKLGSGSILVTSFPSGASIYLDETYEGETPKILANLPQGSPTINLKLEGYKDWQQNIEIASGKTSYIPVALETSTIPFSRLTPVDEEKLLEKFKKEISSFSKQDKENLVNIHFQDGNKNLANGTYEEAKAYFLMAKAISEDLKDQNLVEKAEMLLEVVNTKIENKESTKLIYELLLALGAAVIFGYTFGDTFEKRMKKKVYKYLIIAIAFLLIFIIFYILGRFI